MFLSPEFWRYALKWLSNLPSWREPQGRQPVRNSTAGEGQGSEGPRDLSKKEAPYQSALHCILNITKCPGSTIQTDFLTIKALEKKNMDWSHCDPSHSYFHHVDGLLSHPTQFLLKTETLLLACSLNSLYLFVHLCLHPSLCFFSFLGCTQGFFKFLKSYNENSEKQVSQEILSLSSSISQSLYKSKGSYSRTGWKTHCCSKSRDTSELFNKAFTECPIRKSTFCSSWVLD